MRHRGPDIGTGGPGYRRADDLKVVSAKTGIGVHEIEQQWTKKSITSF